MTAGQPDFVWTDEEDGVVALKNGDDILYVSLYWRAHKGINFLARVHYTTPRLDRIAVVRQETEFEPSGLFYTRRDAIGGAAPGGVHYPDDLHSAEAGEKLRLSKCLTARVSVQMTTVFLPAKANFTRCATEII
jgi:hypothetical protein